MTKSANIIILQSICFRLVVAARFVRLLLFIRIVTGKDQLERATRRMVSKSQDGNVWNWKNFSKPLIELNRLKAACKRMQQQCWELLRVCWQWCANRWNNSQQCWDLQCIVGRIQPISLCKPCVMSMCGPNNVGRAVQTDPTLLRYASAITEQKKCWELLAEKFDRYQTLRNDMQQGVQTDTTCNIQQFWELLANNVASVCMGLK